MSAHLLRALALVLLLYGLILVLAWRYQDRLAFPAPRMRLPAPAAAGLPDRRRVAVTTADGPTLPGRDLPPGPGAARPAAAGPCPPPGSPGVLRPPPKPAPGRRPALEGTALAAGDRVELVHFVGGG